MDCLRTALLFSFVLVPMLGCGVDPHATSVPRATNAAVETPAAIGLAYELEVRIDPERHELDVVGTVRSEPARTHFWLHEDLAIDELADADGPIEFRREGARVAAARPVRGARFRYHGRLLRQGERDFKSHAWIQPNEVRLTEVTLWYPVFYDGESETPWPPVPATGTMSVAPVEGLSWVSSGAAMGGDRFEFRDPSDLVLVGVPFERVTYGSDPTFEIISPRHAALAPTLRATWNAHAQRLGANDAGTIYVVEFPATGTQNGLAFLSSNLIVLSSETCDAVTSATPRSQRVIAHEMAHRWFGGHLRPVGPATRWLVEAFAEYYASLFVRERLGDDEARKVIAELEEDAGELPADLLSLGWTDDRVYTAGALGVRALAEAVGQPTLDAAIRHIHEKHLEWSVTNLFQQLEDADADPSELAAFRRQWGVATLE